MNLDEAQRKKVSEWIAQGLKLSEIQNRLTSELNLALTYMQVRLLVDDLKLTPKDIEPAKSSSPMLSGAPAKGGPAPASTPEPASPFAPPEAAGRPAQVSVTVDKIARPGAVASGKVTFSDGNAAGWQIDQAGRLGLFPQKPGYRPPPEDVQEFQMALETELSRMGF